MREIIVIQHNCAVVAVVVIGLVVQGIILITTHNGIVVTEEILGVMIIKVVAMIDFHNRKVVPITVIEDKIQAGGTLHKKKPKV